MKTSGLSVLVSGMVAGVPRQGGASWAILQYLLGLRRLGHDVMLVEPVAVPPGTALADCAATAYCEKVMSAAGLGRQWALIENGSRNTAGRHYDELVEWSRHADVVLNVSGMLTHEELIAGAPVRAYLDLDPGFNQLWHEAQGVDMHFDGHTHFVTVGLALGTAGCLVPTGGRDWITTLPPVVLEEWPVAPEVAFDALTTVANFRSYGSFEHAGVFYGQKVHSLRPLLDIPKRASARFLLAMSVHPGDEYDLRMLGANGWELVDPAGVVASPDDYRRFVQGSKAEFGLAKSGYVASRSGWFSDRSACYLASGRPVVAQDTGFPAFLPTGAGLLPFATGDDVVEAVTVIASDYEMHRQAARALAEEHLDSDLVLARLLEHLGAS